MKSRNSVAGFEAFQAAIERVTLAIGEPSLRGLVAERFSKRLREEVGRGRRYGWDRPYGTFWTLATAADFEAAARFVLTSAQIAAIHKVVASAPWNGTTIAIRGNRAFVEGGGFCIQIAFAYEDSIETYDRRTRRSRKKWFAAMDNDFTSAGFSGDANARTNANDEAGAMKALRRMILSYTGVKL